MGEIAFNHGLRKNLDYLQTDLLRVQLMLFRGALRNGLYDLSDKGSLENNPLIFSGSDSFLSLTSNYLTGIDNIGDIDKSIIKLESEIAIIKKECSHSGITLRLYELQRLFNLSPLDIDILLICLLPEIDSRLEKNFAYLHDDITRKLPTINLILKLLCLTLEESLAAKASFTPEGPLLRNNLIQLSDLPSFQASTAGARFIRLDERISNYLTGSDRIDNRLKSFADINTPTVTLKDIWLAEDIKKKLIMLTRRDGNTAAVFHFYGITGTGKHTTAGAVCNELKLPLLNIDIRRMVSADIFPEKALALIFREGLLLKAALFFNRTDLLLNRENTMAGLNIQDNLTSWIKNYPHLIVLSSETQLEWDHFPRNKAPVYMEFDLPDYEARKKLWSSTAGLDIQLAKDIDYEALANKFQLTPGQISEVWPTAISLASWRDPHKCLITSDDLYTACRRQSRQRLTALTHLVSARYGWQDIILPQDQKEQLKEICNQIKYRQTVYKDWGFGHKLTRGKGVNAIFSGPSGTGKTMAAEIMGNEVGIDVYKIDLSAIVSKYIGETEKNLDRIFREGMTANAIIFFDEADSLFGKRSEVHDSHDRYANIEVSYLLQKMDDYDGLIILATNFRKNMDDAFTRRMHFVLEFPMPEENYRHLIWKSMFPEKAPVAADIDLAFLARQFTISGGNIRNIVLASAFLAAQDGGVINMEHLIRATRREYQKIGRLCTESDFGRYFEIVKA